MCVYVCLHFLRLHNFKKSVVPRCLCELILLLLLFCRFYFLKNKNNVYVHISIHELSNKFTKIRYINIYVQIHTHLYTVHRYMYILNGNWYSAIWLYTHYITYEPTNKNYIYSHRYKQNTTRKKREDATPSTITTAATSTDLLCCK